jgi:uncharacterized RDD family membrane protein YckC
VKKVSKERIEYRSATFITRLIALLIDLAVGVGIAIFCQLGAELEYEILWSKIFPALGDMLPYTVYIWFIIFFPLYHILCSGFTDGQTLGKLLLGIRVVTDQNESTKRKFRLHFKRFFFLKGGTKVVKEIDPSVTGLT